MFAKLATGLCLMLVATFGPACIVGQTADAQSVTTLTAPGGGAIEFGPVQKDHLSDAMSFMIDKVKLQFSSFQTGDLFKSHDERSIATFFISNEKNDESKHIAGLVIVRMRPEGKFQAAVFHDAADRFASTEPGLLKLLSATQLPIATNSLAGWFTDTPADAEQVDPGPFHLAVTADRSASLCLPENWSLVSGQQGQVSVRGPHKEYINLGIGQMFIDPGSPSAHSIAPGDAKILKVEYPSGGNLFTTFTEVVNQRRAIQKLVPATFTLIRSRSLTPSAGMAQSAEMIFDLDLKEDSGPRKASARVDVDRPAHGHYWFMVANSSSVPVAYAAAEESTLLAIIRSFGLAQTRVGGDMGNQERPAVQDCDEITLAGNTDWPPKFTANYSLEGLDVAVDSTAGNADKANTTASALTATLLKANLGQFEVMKDGEFIRGREYRR
jgi:hypothetical protein